MAAFRLHVALRNGLLATAAFAAGCSSSDMARCELDTECASGFCRADHTCAPADDVDGAPGNDGDPGLDASTTGCVPDHDGTLTRDELVMAAGQTARFKVATD